MLISLQNIRKSYGARMLFKDISMTIESGDRIGLIGPNGAGKSTLLKIMAGIESLDEGLRSTQKLLKLGYVAQTHPFPETSTVEEVLLEALQNEKMEIHEQKTQTAITLGRVGFVQPDMHVKNLSGGWQKRLAIARELVKKPDVLLLDEPTNHLDLSGILWLESLLLKASFTFLVISHDRYFLEHVTNQTVELNRRYPEGYLRANGNYSQFLEKRSAFLALQEKLEETLENKVRQEIAWLRQGAKARTSKAGYRTEKAQQIQEDLAQTKSRSVVDSVQIDFAFTGRKSKKLLVAEQIEKRIQDQVLFKKLSFILTPDVKIGLVGANGSGKTTLLRMLSGEIEPDAGQLTRAPDLKMVVFDQNRTQLDPLARLKSVLSPLGDYILFQGQKIHVISWAKRFLFRTEQLEMPISELSGGEHARVLIANLMRQPADILLLDEPTNDLDIPTLEMLEENLVAFPGAIVLVTHDRMMLERVSTCILALDGKGNAQFYADYAQMEKAALDIPKPAEKVENKTLKSDPKPQKTQKSHISYQEKREWEQIEDKILKAESLVAQLESKIADPAIASDHVNLQTCCNDLLAAQNLVEQLYARWAELDAKQR